MTGSPAAGGGQPLRFGLFVPQGWRLDLADLPPERHWPAVRDLALRADAGPWHSVWVYDHVHPVPVPTDDAVHEAWTLMAALAAVTTRVRLGQMCTCSGYRNPAHLAKVAATVDHVAGGRVDMGIGAGWYEHEWRAYGYGFPSVRDRLTHLDEAVQVMHQLWTTGTSTFAGEQVRTDGALCHPVPPQAGGIPLWVAGGGERRTLRTAARWASATNFSGDDVEVFRHKSRVLRDHCADLGTDYGAITRSTTCDVLVGADEAEVADRRAQLLDRLARRVGRAAAEAEVAKSFDPASPGVGTPEQVVEKLGRLVAEGMSYPVCYFAEAATDTSGVELFEREVVPALRALAG